MQFRYDLSIAGLYFRICSPFFLNLPEYFRPFLVTEVFPAEPDVNINVEAGDLQKDKWLQNNILQSFYWDHGKSIYRLESKLKPEQITLVIPREFQERFAQNANWLLYLVLERPLLHYGRLILHASAVIYHERAYLFTAPSGGGKSTQAEIWEHALHAKVINGDKVVLYDNGTNLIAYGSPIAGSSGIYRNICAPVDAIVQLEKGSENTITPMTMRDRYLLLYGEAVKSDWDADFNRSLLRLASSYPQRTEYVRLHCLADPSAAECLLHYLNTKEMRTIT